ncbi:MAG: YdbH domain-containing protein [Proteobacteria bacterium]|nr:YdbH domain-containing protein [Pseudomonadota bacterium]
MRFKISVKYLFFLVLGLVILSQALFFSLPMVVETIVKRQLPKDLPQGLTPSDLGFKIEKIGLGHALVTHIHLGQEMSADLVAFEYRIRDFARFQFDRVTISGLTLHARLDAENQLLFNGKPFPIKAKEAPKDAGDSNLSFLAPFATLLPHQVVIKDAVLSVSTPDRKISLPFGGTASLDAQQKNLVLDARFHPFGQTVNTQVSGDLSSGIQSVKLTARSFRPEFLSGLLPGQTRILFSGPMDIDLLKSPDTDWQLSISQLELDAPNFLDVKIRDFKASVGTKGKETDLLTAMGQFDISGSSVPETGLAFGFKLGREQGMPPSFELTVNNRQDNSIALAAGPVKMDLGQPRVLFSLKGDPARQTGHFLFDCSNFEATRGGERMTIENILVKTGIQGDFTDTGDGLSFDIQSQLSGMAATSDLGQALFKTASLTGKAQVTKSWDPLVHLDARIQNGKILSPKFKVTASGIKAKFPFVFPFKNKDQSGSFFVDKIVYDTRITAGLKGKIVQEDVSAVSISGLGTLAQLDGFHLLFDGIAKWGADPHTRIAFRTDPFVLIPAGMKKFLPQLSLSADSALPFSSKGGVEYTNNAFKTWAQVSIDKGNISIPNMNLTLNNIAGVVEFNDLLVPESLPGQVLTIDRITSGQFEFTKAAARFSIEDGKSINIENMHFNWCNGLVSTESIRLPAKNNILSLTLYCDRLELAALLKQMGAFHAEGEGALNGRIPVVYSDGNISFDKGFLFSTPGKGGRVVIENTQNLIAGIPMDTPEFAQLDLAREALKDFDYTWAKLELNTQNDTLYMNMELDGKPARLLPFAYQKEIGSFVRVDAASPGSRFQGIKLNVNLKLPFNQVLKFGNNIKKMFN